MMDQYEVAQVLREIGSIIELIDANPKKGIAYRKAANTIETAVEFEKMVAEHRLEELPSIGKSISQMVSTLMKHGYLPYYNHLKNQVPPGLLQLTNIPGLSLSKIRILYEKLHTTSLSELEQALNEGKLKGLKGFGPAYIKKICNRIEKFKKEGPSLLYPQANRLAQALLAALKNNTSKIEIAGALRRKMESIQELDFVVIAKDFQFAKVVTNNYLVEKTLSLTKNQLSVLLKAGIKANFHFSTPQDFPFILLGQTGNHAHFEQLKRAAAEKGYLLNEHSLLSSKSLPLKLKSERDVYRKMGLFFIPPELREGLGEIEAAKENPFSLIEYQDLRGTFHCHTMASDGVNTLEELAAEARKMGWEYIGISDHSKSSTQAHGLSEERLLEQREQIHAFNKRSKDFRLFAGVECDVLKDGKLDFADQILSQLDFVIVSIHRFFDLPEKEMTRRLIKAIENPYTTMIGHLTGRLIRTREPYFLNVPKIIDACIANNKVIELNAYPNRLDMAWTWWIKAREKGLKCSINPDAHTLKDLMNCQYGIHIARKGWLTKRDVINTLPLKEMQNLLKNMRSS